jgi:hypothetical protein
MAGFHILVRGVVPDFGKSVDPISTRGTNYAHLIATGTQRAKFSQKVHKPPLGVIVINFELMHSYGSPGVPQTPTIYHALIEIFKFIDMWKETRSRCILAPILAFQ